MRPVQADGHVAPRDVELLRDLSVRAFLDVPQLHDLAERGRQMVGGFQQQAPQLGSV